MARQIPVAGGIIDEDGDRQIPIAGVGIVDFQQGAAPPGVTVVPSRAIDMGWYSPLGDVNSGGLIQ